MSDVSFSVMSAPPSSRTLMPRLLRFGVVGAGQMGAGIAQVLASSSSASSVLVTDTSTSALTRSVEGIASSLARFVSKGRISADARDAAMHRIATSSSIDDLHLCDVIVEAVPEDESLKRQMFAKLDHIVRPQLETPSGTTPWDFDKNGPILATNTSSVSITRIASATRNASRVVGVHFMNPVPIMKLVEIIPGADTCQAAVEASVQIVNDIGKVPVAADADRPGFIVNRILMPYINEAFFALMEGVSRDPHAIDTAMQLGTNVPMGPLTLADHIGLDTCLSIMRVLHHGLGDDKYRPCPLLVSYVDAQRLGKKAGRGVFEYK